MDQDGSSTTTTQSSAKGRRWLKIVVCVLAAYLLVAYVLLPLTWDQYARHHPAFDDDPRVTRTGDDHPGDPLNVALIGTESRVKDIMQAAGWYPAAGLGLRSDLKIAADTVFSRPDDEAPVSSLFLYGRKEDLAFEQPVGDNPRQRNHVRFWKSPRTDSDDGPIWIGSASYDERVGLSHTTGQVTHHISGDIDKERDHLFDNLRHTGELSDFYKVDRFHNQLEGRNGGGDKWHTDGALYVGVLNAETAEANTAD